MSGAPRIVRFAGAPRMPWKNGGGETVEVVVHPPGGTFDAFGWRVSLATITGDGPFSTVHDVDRTFAVLQGDDMVLTVGAGLPARLEAGDQPVRFAGEAPCQCSLSGGLVTALNVMTRHGSFHCAVAPFDPAAGLPRVAGAVTFLVCRRGEIGTGIGPLGALDVLIVPPHTEVDIAARRPAAYTLTVSIWSVDDHRPAGCP